jgi:hypothetical protein
MQIHNLVDWRTHLPTLRRWKARAASATSASRTTPRRAYAEVEAVLRSETLDFLQINYSLASSRRPKSACCRWRPSAAWR